MQTHLARNEQTDRSSSTLGDLGGSDVKPGGGVGVRFLLAKQNRINLRFDYAWGQDSSAFYIGLGEAF